MIPFKLKSYWCFSGYAAFRGCTFSKLKKLNDTWDLWLKTFWKLSVAERHIFLFPVSLSFLHTAHCELLSHQKSRLHWEANVGQKISTSDQWTFLEIFIQSTLILLMQQRRWGTPDYSVTLAVGPATVRHRGRRSIPCGSVKTHINHY